MRGVCGLAIDRERLSGSGASATAYVRVQLATHAWMKPPSVLNASGRRAHDPLHDGSSMHREHRHPRRPRS